MKEDFLAAARQYKDLSLVHLKYPEDGSIYVNDHLTLYNKSLLSKAKALAKEKKFRFVWVKHCKIFVRKAANVKSVIIIQTEKDFLKIC